MYSLNNTEPVHELPHRIKIDGMTRTDNTTFTAEEIAQAGWVEVPDKPEQTPEVKSITWDDGWIVELWTIDELRTKLKAQVKELHSQMIIRPRVDTPLGFAVDGGVFDILSFEGGKALGVDTVRDADNQYHAGITSEDYDTIILSIRQKGLEIHGWKWQKETEIDSLATIEECLNYEAE